MAESKGIEDLQKQLEPFKDWYSKQPHLPKDLDDKLLLRFLHSCYYDMEKAKNALELFCSMRASSPELFGNRDPHSAQYQKYIKIVNLAQLKISGNRNLWIWQFNEPGMDNFDYVQDARVFIMSTDAWFLTDDGLEEADVVIMDVKDITLKLITKFNVSVARKVAKYQQDAMPIRLKQIHVVNAPPFIDKIFSLLKPFLKQDITEMIHFHAPNSETLYQYIKKEELPKDYGGENGTMAEHMKKVVDIVESLREVFLNDNLWKAVDKKSKNKGESSTAPSFRSLAID